MSVIEGIGDEVVQFFSVVIVVVFAVAAWWSTSIREGHHIRTVVILERRSRNRTSGEVQPAVTTAENDNNIDTGQEDNTDGVETEILTDDSQDKDESEASGTSAAASVEEAEGEGEAEVEGEEGAAAAVVEPEDTSASVCEASLRKRLSPLLKSAAVSEGEQSSHSTADEESETDQIRIRLKYLNDDQKLVEGRLQEPLGEFKRRHFRMELSADKLVRLIFNGHVLGSDQQTLQACGLYDNCVVHCLVHSQRMSQRAPSQPQPTPAAPASPPDWNLSTLLYTCLSLVLCVVWYCRYQYAQLFTLTTTAALIGLTGIFTVSVFSLYLPDTDGIPH